MHWYNNPFFIAQLSEDLNKAFKGLRVIDCFSTSIDDAFLVFEDHQCLHFKFFKGFVFMLTPSGQHLPKRNRQPLFPELLNQTIESIEAFDLSRAFSINFGQNQLVLKSFGRNANLILFETEVLSVFKTKGNKDMETQLEDFHFRGDKAEFIAAFNDIDALINTYYVFNPYMKDWLKQRTDVTYSAFLDHLKNLSFSINEDQSIKIEAHGEYKNRLELSHEFAKRYTYWERYKSEKAAKLNELNQNIKRLEKKVFDTLQRQKALGKLNYRNIGDLIMANLNQIDSQQTAVELTDFYTNQPVKIKLKKGLSPQKNAEKFYDKAKNQHKEEKQINLTLNEFRKKLAKLIDQKNAIEEIVDPKIWSKKFKGKIETVELQPVNKPYKTYEKDGFEIRVGKSAKHNDALITQHAQANDVWLHAREIKGSHVIIRTKGKDVPKQVLTFAAELAAYYSKEKSSHMVPVIYTQRKFVRKFKGAPPGTVKVDRESVLIVEPYKPD